MIHSELSNQLFINGILSNDGKGHVKLDTGKAADLLRNLEKYPLKFMKDGESYPQAIRQNTDRLFASERLLLYPRHSFFTQLLEEKNIGGWKVALHPSAEDSPFGSDLSVLALNKNNPCPHESLLLLEYLCSKEIQEKFSRLHGNFAIYSELYDSRAKLKGHPIQYEVIHETLEKSYRQWSTVNVCKEIKDAVEVCGYRFFTRQASAEETLKRLKLIVETHSGSQISEPLK